MRRKKRRFSSRGVAARHRQLLFESLENRRVLAGTATVTGSVFADADQDGLRDAGEVGAVGIVVFADHNGNGVRNGSEPFTTTLADDPGTTTINEAGSFVLSGVNAGTVNLLIEPGANQRQSSPLQDPIADGALIPFDVLPQSHISGVSSPRSLVVSPDGNYALSLWFSGERIGSYQRNAQDGTLSLTNTYTYSSPKLFGAREAIFSPAGDFVYVAADYDNAISVFSTSSTGALSFVQVVDSTSLGSNDLDGVYGLAITPDGTQLLATARQSKTLMVFAIDPATGQLTLSQKFQDGLDGITSLDVPANPIITPDGTAVVIPSDHGFRSLFFDRDPATGILSVGQPDQSLGFIDHGVITADGRFVFLAASSSSIIVLERNATTGDFSEIGSVSTGGIVPSRLAISPDQTALYFHSNTADAIGRFSLDAATGTLTLEQTLFDVLDVPDMEVPAGLEVSPDGANVYLTASTSRTIHTFDVNQGIRSAAAFTVTVADGETVGGVEFGLTTESPQVVSLQAVSSGPVAATSIDFTVTFSENVTGVDATDFALVSTTFPGAAISDVTGGPAVYTVTVSTPSGAGNVAIELIDDDTIVDSDLVPIGDVGTGGIIARSESVLVDVVAPTVAAIVPQPIVPAGATTIDFYVSFEEPVLGVDSLDFTTTDTGATVSSVSAVSGDGQRFRVTVDLAGGDGTTTLQLVDNDSIVDPAGNPLGGSGTSGTGDGSFTGVAYAFAPPALHGTIWFDTDRDGLRDQNEDGVAGQLVYADLNQNESFDAGEPSTITTSDDPGTTDVDEAGHYILTGLTANTSYQLRTAVPTGWAQTFPRDYPLDDSSLQYVDSLYAGVEPDRNFDRIGAIHVGADGNHVYTTALNSHELTVFERNGLNAAMTKIQEFGPTSPNLNQIYSPNDFVITPDGRFAYLAAGNNDVLYAFSRGPINGQLAFLERYDNNTAGIVGLDNPIDLEISPDGSTLYVVNANSNRLLTFAINTSTGQLTPRQTFFQGIGGVTAMGSPQSVAVTPDGLQVVVSATSESALNVFDVDPGTGLLYHRETINGVYYVHHTAVAPDGRFLYAAERYAKDLEVFSRDSLTGAWTRLPSIATGTDRLAGVAISPDGTSLYVADELGNAIKVFDRDASTGGLTERQTIHDVAPHDRLSTPWTVAVTPDGKHVLVGAQNDDALTTFVRRTSLGVAAPHRMTTTYQESGALNFGLSIEYPEVVSISSAESSPSTSASIDFQVTFSEPVSGVDATDFRFATTSLVGPNVTNIAGGPTEYTVTVAPGSGQGTLQLQLFDDDTIIDGTSDPLAGPGGLGVIASSAAIDVDLAPPTVVRFDPIGDPVTQATTLTFSLAFSETVSGVDLGDLQPLIPSGSTITGATITAVSLTDPLISDHIYTVTLTYTGGEGTVGVRLVDDDSIVDALGQPLGGAGANNGKVDSNLFDVAFTGRIAGRFVEDLDLDGYADLGEPGVVGATVFADANQNGILDPGEKSAITVGDDPGTTHLNEAGHYFIAGLDPGDYTIVVSPPPGWSLTNPTSRLAASGDLTFVETILDNTGGVNFLDEAAGVTESPDGNYLYVASYNDDSVTVFSRDAATGRLTLQQQLVNGVSGVAGLLGAQSIAISLDGRHLYVASALDDALVMFQRDVATGLLTYLGHLKDNVNGVDGLNEAVGIQISDDGKAVYVAAFSDNSLTVFTRDSSTGLLSYAQKLSTNSLGTFDVELSPDQRFVYSSAANSDAINVYERDPASGLLTWRQSIRDTDAGVSGLNGASGISISGDGKNLYVAGYFSQGTTVLNRDTTTGVLTFNQFLADPFPVTNPYPISIEVSPDGHQVVTMFEVYDAIAVYTRNPTTGKLTLNETHRDGFGGINGLNGAWDAGYSNDDRFLYVVGAYDDAVVVFGRDVGQRVPATITTTVEIGRTSTLPGFAGVNEIPRIDSVRYVGATPIETTSIDVEITFTEPVIGLDTTDLLLGGTVNGTAITNLTGDGSTYVATISIPDDQGTLIVTVLNDGTITDAEGQPLAGGSTSLGPLQIDRKDPQVVSIVPATPGPYSDYYIDYIVDFNEPVTGVVKDHFSLIGTAVQAGVWSVNASSTIPGRYFVEVRFGPELTSTIGLQFNDDDTVTDGVGRVVGGSGIGNGDFASELVTIDRDTEIYGTVWDDLNGNSLIDDGEPKRIGATVYLDLDLNGQLDPATEPFQLTADDDPLTTDVDERGTYGFAGLPFNATYQVRVINSDADIQQTHPSKGRLYYESYFGANDHLGYREKDLLLSDDDRFLYVLDMEDQTLSVYQVATDSTDVTLIQVLRSFVDGVEGLRDPRGFAFSPDERQIYTVGYDGDEVGVFTRDPSTGLLTYQQVLRSGVGGVAGVYEPTMVAASPDGKYVYAGRSTIAVFSRDNATGLLTYEGFVGTNSTFVRRQMKITSDNQFMYVAADGGGVVTYQIDPTTGFPAPIDVVSPSTGIPSLVGEIDIAISPDERFLYAVAKDAGALTVFERNATTGLLSLVQVVNNSDAIHDGLNQPLAVEVSDDGNTLYVTCFYDTTLSLFDIDTTTGMVSIQETFTRYEEPFIGGANDVVVSSDGQSLFTSSRFGYWIHQYRATSGLRVADTYDLRASPGRVYTQVDFGLQDLPPEVVSIESVLRNRESGPTTDLLVKFSEPVTGVDETDFVLVTSGLTGTAVQAVNGTGTDYVVTVATGTIDPGLPEGTLTLRIADDDTIRDGSGDPLSGAGPLAPLAYPSETIVVERTAPIIESIRRLDPEKSAYSLVDYSIQFSETVINFDATDFDLSTPGLAGVTVSEVTGSIIVNVKVATGSGSGEIHLRLRPDHDITDIAGNPLAIDGFATADPSQTVYLIERGPTVTIAGVKFDDVDGDGVQDVGEPGLPGWTIFLDANDNGLLDAGETSQVTGADGSYAFTGLYSGVYDVAEVFQSGWQQTLPGRGGRNLERVTVDANDQEVAQGGTTPSLSGDGRLVAFVSTSPDLVNGSGNVQNVFVRDLQTGITRLISAAHDGGAADGDSYYPVLSDNGQFVVFMSAAGNLVTGDTNNKQDIFLHDLGSGTTERISVALDGTEANEHSNFAPDISADGRFVVFGSGASNLVAGDTNIFPDVFLLDRQAGTLEIISISGGFNPRVADGPSSHPSVSDDGRYVAFLTNAKNLGSITNNSGPQVMIRDRANASTLYVSTPSTNGSTPANDHSGPPSISGDGRIVTYWSASSNILSGDTTNTQDLFWYAVSSKRNDKVFDSLQEGPPASAIFPRPDISREGGFITFASASGDLVAGDSNFRRDVFVYDLNNETMELVSANLEGFAGDQDSDAVAISADGSVIAFDSQATQLVQYDLNNTSDVFVANRSEPFTPFRYRLTAAINASLTDVDFGNWQATGAIRGTLWQDTNRDGIRQPGEPAIVGRDVFLDANQNGILDGNERTTTSDTRGDYAFSGLTAGIYEPYQVLPVDWAQHSPLPGNDHSVAFGVNLVTTIDFDDLTSGQTLDQYRSGVFVFGTDATTSPRLSAAGTSDITVSSLDTQARLFLSRRDGEAFDLTSITIGHDNASRGWDATLTGWRLFGAPVSQTFVTGAGGTVLNVGFEDIVALTIEPEAGAPALTIDDIVLGYDRWSQTSLDFGSMIQVGAIEGVLWKDDNSDGVIDATEERLATRSVFLDTNGDGIRQIDEPFTLTDGLGQYTFTDLEPGDYKVGVPLPPGWVATNVVGVVTVTANPGQTATQNFGSRPLPSSISGVVWIDDDLDGVRDSGEAGVADVTVYLDQNDNGLLDAGELSTTTTDDDLSTSGVDETGAYRFDNLEPGDYIVRQVVLGGYVQTAPNAVTLEVGERTLTDFVYPGFQQHPDDDLRLSANGRYLVFATAKQLLAADTNSRRDIYLLDRLTQTTELISVNNSGEQGNANHFEPDVSEDGRYVIFRSGSTNLDPSDTGGSHDLYLRDRELGTTTLLTRGVTGGPAGGHTADGILSPDGQRVSFFSLGGNLVPGDNNGRYDTFVLDRSTGLFERVSVNEVGTQVNDASSWGADISSDGRYVVFESQSDALLVGDSNGTNDVFWRDRVTGETRLASTASDGTQGNAASQKRTISDNGRWVAFDSYASNLTSDPHPGPGESAQVYLKDMVTGAIKRISLPQTQGAYPGDSRRPEMSADGRFIVFESDGMLVDGDTNQRVDIYLYDRLNDSLHLVSGGTGNFPGRGFSNNAVISADGTTIAFTTTSSNVTSGDPIAEGGIAVVEVNKVLAAYHVSLPADTDIAERDFGIGINSGLVSGVVFNDLDSNGTREVGEAGLSDWTVFVDTNENGQFDLGEPVTTTLFDDPQTTGIDEAGTFAFPGLLFGSYQIVLVPKAGYTHTSPINVAAVLASGTTVANVEFAVHQDPSSIRGTLWNDANGNGTLDAGEERLPGRTVFLDANDNQRLDPSERFVVTASDDPATGQVNEAGTYLFEDVTAGPQTIVQVLPLGWRQTSPGPSNFDVETLVLQGYVNGQNTGTNPYYDSALSDNGRFVAFTTTKSLLPQDNNTHNDLYVLDRDTDTLELASVDSDENIAGGPSFNPSISDDGRFVVFRSHAFDLVSGDTNGDPDIFLRDRVNGTTTLVSFADPSLTTGSPTGNSWSYSPSISGDGRFITYWSDSTNLVPGDTNNLFDLFLYDVGAGTTERINLAPDGQQATGGQTHNSKLSADGRFVVFWSRATNLVEADTNGAADIFVLDRFTGITERVSTSSSGGQSDGESLQPSISDDGRYVVFHSLANNLVANPGNGFNKVFLKDRQTGETKLISEALDGTSGNGGSLWPSISGDGRWVVFHSLASNLVEGDSNGKADVFLYDTAGDTLTLISGAEGGGPSDGASDWIRISGDGTTITFNSDATNLTPTAAAEGGLYTASLRDIVAAGQGRAIVVGAGQSVSGQDFGSQIHMDFGDAPVSYGTNVAGDGPRHALDPAVRLGNIVSGEADSAGNDDHSDDDGVSIHGSLVPGLNHTFDVNPSSAGTLAVWIDLNGNGSFENASERTEFNLTSPGWQQVTVAVPANAIEGNTYARFRFSSDAASVANPTGPAIDGEVEDYAVQIASPPLVEQVLINEGETQRSSVDRIRITFDRVVELAMLTGSPLTVRNTDTNLQATTILAVDHSSGKTVIDVSFDPAGQSVASDGSLEDGNYELIVHANGVSASGVDLDGDADGQPGGDYRYGAIDGFFSKFGDINGNGTVDLLDFAEFRRAFGKASTESGFQSEFDSDNDGTISLIDFAAFRRNFGK